MSGEYCTLACWDIVVCTNCELVKAPFGRSAPVAAAAGYCHCPAYGDPPKPGHYWRGEEPELFEEVKKRTQTKEP